MPFGPARRLFRLNLLGRRAIERQVDDEIRFHIEERTEQLIAAGLSPDAARASAERMFGDMDSTRHFLRASTRRREGRMQRSERFARIAQDARYAFRQMRRERAFTIVAVMTLAIGIAANAIMFGVVDRLMLRPPAHVRDADRVGRVLVARWMRGSTEMGAEVSYRRFIEMRNAVREVAELAAIGSGYIMVGRGTDTERVVGGYASQNFFPLTGVRPVIGRFFTPDEDLPPDGTKVAVLGHALWMRRFGGDPEVLGKQIRFGSADFTIVGVAPPDFAGVGLQPIDVWVPATAIRTDMEWLDADWWNAHNFSWATMIARLRPGVTAERATAALTAAYTHSVDVEGTEFPQRAWPKDAPAPRAELSPLLAARGPNPSAIARISMWLAGVAAVVLLIACANVANLLLVRGLQRRREIAVRLALGAGRARLLGQLLVESLILAALGGTAGLLLAHWAGSAIRGILMPSAAWNGALHDPRVLAFTAIATLATGLIAGVVPALQSSRPDLTSALKTGTREGGGRASRLRGGLLVAQAALAVVLLVGAGLFVRSLHNIRTADLGIDASRLLIAEVDYRGAEPPTVEGRAAHNSVLLDALRQTPGVEAATTSLSVPFSRSASTRLATVHSDSAQKEGRFLMNGVGPDYFRTMGMEIIRGRPLTNEDRAGSPNVIVVTESMAAKLWPGEDALGQCLRVGGPDSDCSEVVGIARNAVHDDLTGIGETLQYWFPESQRQGNNGGVNAYFARVRGEPGAILDNVREAMQAQLSGDASVRVRAFGELLEPEQRPWRLGATMFSAFGLLALLIAAIGLYGVIAYQVGQRTHEIGVRMALGAKSRDLTRMVLWEGLRLTMIGLALGAAVALAAGRWVAPLLFGVSPFDPAVYAGVIATLSVVAIVACLVPAMRAAGVDPSSALRAD